MSSDHIVRDMQEPALLLLDADTFPDEYLGQLLEWSPTVIATTESFEKLVSRQIKVDWLMSEALPETIQSDIQFITSARDHHLSDAIDLLIEKRYSAVNIITAAIDLSSLKRYLPKINIVVYSGNEKIYPIRSGYRKWLPAGETILLKEDTENLSIVGMESTADGVYKTSSGGIITINFKHGYMFISEKAY